MVKIFAFLTKREDLETQAFIDYYENHHVPLISSLAPTPIVYKRNYLMRGDELNRQEDDTIDFDVVTELCLQTGRPISPGVPRSGGASRSPGTRSGFSIGRGPGPM
jgi:hypothetical protein